MDSPSSLQTLNQVSTFLRTSILRVRATFSNFFSPDVVDSIVLYTNAYAVAHIAAKANLCERQRSVDPNDQG